MAVVHRSAEGVIRVLVADSTRIHTQLLVDALRRDRALDVVGCSSQARELIEAASSHHTQVAVISSSLEEQPLHGLEVLRELRAARPEVRVITLLDSSKREVVVEAFRAGARGVFSRAESVEMLGKCVRQVYEGQIWANSEQMAFAVEALAASPSVRAVNANGLNLLSKRELEVVRCLAEGLSNREIAERLGLSQHTIKNYLFRVFDKLGVSSRVELLFLTLSQPAQHPVPIPPIEHISVNGHSVAEESPLALCQKAAEQGIPTAQIALAQMYWHGKGVARNLVSAYMWYLVAERSSIDMQTEIANEKSRLAESLDGEQLLEAQNLAGSHPKRSPRAVSMGLGSLASLARASR